MYCRIIAALLGATLFSACATPIYQSPPPNKSEVAAVEEKIQAHTPQAKRLSYYEAVSIVTPIFERMKYDAAMICRSIAEAGTCNFPAFEVWDIDEINAHAAPDEETGRPKLVVYKGLVEQFHDDPDALAMVIGHEYGHLLSAHIEEDRRNRQRAGGFMGATLGILAAASMAASNANSGYQNNYQPTYSQAEIAYVTRSYAILGYQLGASIAHLSFSKGQENEADYIGTYLAARAGYEPTGDVFVEMGALGRMDTMTTKQKREAQKSFAYWNTHPAEAERVVRIAETKDEIEELKAQGYRRPIPPKLIETLSESTSSMHSLRDLVE